MLVMFRTDSDIPNQQRREIERRLRFGLTRFEPRLRRVVVNLAHVATPVHGLCWHVGLDVDLQNSGDVKVREIDREISRGIDRATARAARVVERRIGNTQGMRGVG